ncbi:RibD family protein [Chloroflexus sp.]|uniref:RibD family protein n=1 Tax=Chloroflexus sp. TaxID=1904827 RepID=UPI00404A3539
MMRPRVTLCFAQTLDGRVAAVDGSSQWISGPESLHFCHHLRANSDAIMVGVGTVLRDDPRLTTRLVAGPDPLRVIVDTHLRTPTTAAVIRDGAGVGTLLACTAAATRERRIALQECGATVLTMPEAAGGGVDLAALLAILGERGIASVMVEGGARLITSLLRANLVDALAVTIAPIILGSGPAAIGDLGILTLSQALRLTNVTWTTYGTDVVIEGDLANHQ